MATVTVTLEGIKNLIAVRYDELIPHAEIEHNGHITWDEIQIIKNTLWGKDAVAIEVYPPEREVVNTGNFRHIWLLGPRDFYPSIVDSGAKSFNGSLEQMLAVNRL